MPLFLLRIGFSIPAARRLFSNVANSRSRALHPHDVFHFVFLQVRELGRGRVDLTIGSALDIFGGKLAYEEVVRWQRQEEEKAAVSC